MFGEKIVENAAKGAVKAALEAGLIERLFDSFKKKQVIVVLGATGVGKTNLLDSLESISPKIIHQLNRTEFAKERNLRIDGNPFEFVDTPGQIEHKSRRIEAIRNAMAKGKVGVINIVSYGFHEHRSATWRDAVNDDGTVKEDFVETQRQVELTMLSEWVPLLGSKETSSWLMTIVSKADLWWDNQADVMNYYTTEEYFRCLGDGQSLNPVVIPYCSVFKKFYGEGLLSGRFDEENRTVLRDNLFSRLLYSVGMS